MGNRAMSRELIELGGRIRNRRKEIRLSQEALAEKIEICSNTVSRIEGGQMAMSVEIFTRLVLALKTDANELLDVKSVKCGNNVQLSHMAYQIERLKKHEQEIVLQTVNALVQGLRQCR